MRWFYTNNITKKPGRSGYFFPGTDSVLKITEKLN
jgi:hypothetical protein